VALVTADPTILLELGSAPPLDAASVAVAPAEPRERGPRASPRARAALLAWLLPVVVLLAAEAAGRLGWVTSNLLPTPSDVARALFDLGGHTVLAHVMASTARVAAGYAIGAALALAIGSLVGLSSTARALLDPSFQALRAIPSLAWVPLLLLWLGIGEAPKLAMIAIGAFFPVYMGVVAGIRGVDRKLVEVARLMRLGPLALVRRVLLPAALPSVMTGLRNGLSLAWMFMVAGELIAAGSGLGYLLTDGRETSRADLVLAAIVLLAVLGKLSDTAMARLERRLLSWRDVFDDDGAAR
jgi:sulfonate transport system permease protein